MSIRARSSSPSAPPIGHNLEQSCDLPLNYISSINATCYYCIYSLINNKCNLFHQGARETHLGSMEFQMRYGTAMVI